MSDISKILSRAEQGDAVATDELLPLVYAELKQLASRQLAREQPNGSLNTTALVHEAYLRLIGNDQNWDTRGHFLVAAAESMRRILVDRARQRRALKRGGDLHREALNEHQLSKGPNPDEVVVVSDLLDTLAVDKPQVAEIVKLHYFAGLSINEASRALGISGTRAHRDWVFAKAWLRRAMKREND